MFPAEVSSSLIRSVKAVSGPAADPHASEPSVDFLPSRGQWGVWARIGLATFAIILALSAERREVFLWLTLFVCWGFALAIWGLRRNPGSYLRLFVSMAIDLAVITVIVWAAGSCAYPLPIFYPVFVIGYAMRGGLKLGRLAAVLAIVTYGSLLGLEYFWVIPRAPLGGPGAVEYIQGLTPHVALAVVSVAILISYLFVASTLGRIRFYVKKERRLLVSERQARAQSEVLQDKLDEAERLESLGRLAGGVAHDFNNLLTSIMGHARLVQEETPPDSQAWHDLNEVLHAAQQGAELTSQLLAYGRRQLVKPETLDLNNLVQGTGRLLERTLGEDIDLRILVAPEPALVEADRNQLERVLVNLSVNARDAMPKGGVLEITTDIETNRDWVTLEVRDSGCGMSTATIAKIFEPFFTSKETGKGTGLGLAMVYGAVRQSGGTIMVDSAPNEGAVFMLRFPRASGAVSLAAAQGASDARGHETVLVVEDDDKVRGLTERALSHAGYQVITASNGEEALAKAIDHETGIDLLLSDVVMPGLNGMDFVNALTQLSPGAAVLFMSGYTADSASDDSGQRAILGKPFTRDELLSKVRQALDFGGVGATAEA